MTLRELWNPEAAADHGRWMYEFIATGYPLCRSLTGEGVRQTLRLIQQHVPVEIHEVPSGTPVFDWTVPQEWNIRDAYIADRSGRRVVDFRASNLHVMSYSVPVRARLSLAELRPHLFTLPEQPGLIPYRTSYYSEQWGFCLAHERLLTLEEDEYEVVIDSTLAPGSLSYGELLIPGRSAKEILLHTHICHPSLCNDNLSGIAIATRLAASLAGRDLRYGYRFLFLPGTIGAITWLARNEAHVSRIRHGFVLTGLGDPGHTTYKRSRRGTAEIDRATVEVLKRRADGFEVVPFSPYGYDERQYCSPGFDLPVGCLMRTPHGRYPEYHTSADDLTFVRPECLGDSLSKLAEVLDVLEENRYYASVNPKCEPQLGRRGLYGSVGGSSAGPTGQMALLWVLNLADGRHSLLDMAERAQLSFWEVAAAARRLLQSGLLEEVQPGS